MTMLKVVLVVRHREGEGSLHGLRHLSPTVNVQLSRLLKQLNSHITVCLDFRFGELVLHLRKLAVDV